MIRRLTFILLFLGQLHYGKCQTPYTEPYRPQLRFSPKAHWMNDPNGMVYFKGIYHLFFQYYPDSTVWGPMHWGHATSKDLLHWKEQPIALFPDSLGYIFSGSAVIDINNTSGFGKPGKIPLVAIFTQHDPIGEKEGTNHFQNQSIAYSTDGGIQWQKYQYNPVLKTPGLKDFRDPKVIWYPELKEWMMILAAGDRVMFYSSANLKSWKKESEFFTKYGAHGGVWECPDLMSFIVNQKRVWVLFVSINPGGFQGGSATQYFTGRFDGHRFTPNDTILRWIDYGPDNYAGVTWSNTGRQKIFLGWMSNWLYGTKTPTETWRSAMTIPRSLDLKFIGQHYFLTMQPIQGLNALVKDSNNFKTLSSYNNYYLSGLNRLDFSISDLQSFTFMFTNVSGQKLLLGFDKTKNSFFIDRRAAGKSDFDSEFARVYYAKRIAFTKSSNISIVLDRSSVELFADGGLTTMTEIFFSDQPFDKLQIVPLLKTITNLKISTFNSIWQ